MLVALLCTLFLGLFLFKPSKELVYDREQIVAKQAALGKLSVKEIRTIVWLVIAIALWLTVSGDYIGWVTLAIG
ncbi:SLC13 family permease, partial [Streptococcus gordonii]|nr:SLC13 family permease [Streptococcus gordonii]